jgi:hypothetical protein
MLKSNMRDRADRGVDTYPELESDLLAPESLFVYTGHVSFALGFVGVES